MSYKLSINRGKAEEGLNIFYSLRGRPVVAWTFLGSTLIPSLPIKKPGNEISLQVKGIFLD